MGLEHGCSWQQKLQLSSTLQPTWKQANHLRLSGPPYSPHGKDQQIRTSADIGGDLSSPQNWNPISNIIKRREQEQEK